MASPSSRHITPRPWMLLPFAVLAAIPMGIVLGRGPVILTLAACVLLMVVWIFWESLQNLTGDAPLTLEEAIGLGAPTPEEERKRSVLRILKDLEYERSVGKLSEEDFQELSTKYREEAKALLQLLDGHLGPARERASELLKEKLESESVAAKPEPESSSALEKGPEEAIVVPQQDSPLATQEDAEQSPQLTDKDPEVKQVREAEKNEEPNA